MPGRNEPTVLASAGAITTENRIGVSSGTAISRGGWALNENRRRARVARTDMVVGPSRRWSDAMLGSETGGVAVMVDMAVGSPFRILRRLRDGCRSGAG